MDSGNSGSLSLQSSSGGGGDDEFDSRCGGEDSSPLSALLRQPPAPSSSVLPGFAGSFYGIHNLATPPQPMSHWSSTTPLPAGTAGGVSPSLPSSSCHGAAASTAVQDSPAQAGPAPAAAPPRGSRKRTRASRRAPTTVLTTNTSNFRAMVQEFTGVPAPPFAAAGAAPARSRFDHLFPSRSAAGSPAAALSLPYLLRPFAQKLQASSPYPPPFIAPSTAAVASSRDSYQLASAPSNVLGMQDHISGGSYLSFQSPIGAQLDGNARYPSAPPMFDAAGLPPAQRLPDPAGFSGVAHGAMNSEGTTHLRPRHRDHGHSGDELSGLVRAASVSSAADGCKATYSSGAGSAATRAGPLLERNAQSTTTVDGGAATPTTPVAASTAAMRAQGVESWICTSE